MGQDLLTLATAREGHFRLESGHHGRRWLDLDGLFTDPARIGPFVDALAERVRAHEPEAVCGPLVGGAFLAQMLAARLACDFLFTERLPSGESQGLYGVRYRLPRGLRGRARGKRIAIVDDAISAGSSVRATYDELRALGGRPVVVGALLLLGSAALPFFEPLGIPFESVTRIPYEMWAPAECPLCASGQLLEEPWSNERNEGGKP
jgi:orotate phosphoribosyltransferase